MEADLHILDKAGSETVANILSCAINYQCQNPAVLKNLADEIRGAVVVEADRTIGILSQLPYLTTVMKESLRICFPTVLSFPRVVPSKCAFIFWLLSPRGVHLLVCLSILHARDIG